MSHPSSPTAAAPTLEKTYQPDAIEARWYAHWESEGLFKPEQAKTVTHASGKPFSIVIPPPNVTGNLHMGHALDNTLQDILIRWHRMAGDTALWMPGTDHAGIATQSVVERQLKAEGTTRHDLGRDAFMDKTWEWVHQCQGNITGQLRKLGVSPDWSRQRFTLDDGCSDAVKEAFCSLYDKGLLYRGEYIVNWDPDTQSAISDIEVEYADEASFLWHVAFATPNGGQPLVIATTRPETLYGDVAVAVHPKDERYQHLVGQTLVHPLTGRNIPVITDEYVDPDFGTGCLKITPAHDPNDFEIGKRHNLENLKVLDIYGRIMDLPFIPEPIRGMDRFEARTATEALLIEKGVLAKKEEHHHRVGRAQRSGAIVEPLLSKQWFVNTKPLAEMCLKSLDEGHIQFVPERWTKDYLRWMTNIQDWCISRQLWWGHRIPAWYCADCDEITVAKTEPNACQHCHSANITQDPDVLDTWFSSGLWPFSTMGWPNTDAPDYQTFYPTSVLVTGFDIIFFWVARMTMFGHAFTQQSPFHTVYIHGLIRDEKGQKMSKSKGNTVDPVESIERYGCDAFRWALTSLITYGGQDIKLAPGVMEQGRLFTNKLWNAARFVLMNLHNNDGTSVDSLPIDETQLSSMDRWILSRYHFAVATSEAYLLDYKFGELASLLYEFTWNAFCDWYVEAAKTPLRNPETRANTQRVLLTVLEGTLRLLHPIMPFITEEIWQQLPHTPKNTSISLAPYPAPETNWIDPNLQGKIQLSLSVVRALRNIKQQYGVGPRQPISVVIEAAQADEYHALNQDGQALIGQFVPLNEWTLTESLSEPPARSAVNVVSQCRVFVPLADFLDVDQEKERLNKKLADLSKEQEKLAGMLNNPDFVARAPEAVVAKNQALLTEANQQVMALTEQLSSLG